MGMKHVTRSRRIISTKVERMVVLKGKDGSYPGPPAAPYTATIYLDILR